MNTRSSTSHPTRTESPHDRCDGRRTSLDRPPCRPPCIPHPPASVVATLTAALLSAWMCVHAQGLKAVADRPTALYRVGETVTFNVTLAAGTPVAPVPPLAYQLRVDDYVEAAAGRVALRNGRATVTHVFERPGWVLLYVTPPAGADGKPPRPVLAGAMCEPERLQPGMPCPEDFQAFWTKMKAETDAIALEPSLVPVPSLTDDKRETYALQLRNIRGTTIQGFVSKPCGPGPFPAVLRVNAAGVYGIRPGGVASYAALGALALDINPHDIPNGRPQEFYDELKRGVLRAYSHIGRDSRETSYFLRMFCSCYRTLRYIMSRPDWDGKHLVVWGSSQGGGQSIVSAGLCPEVTAITANVPALCDHGGMQAQRRPGWPQWTAIVEGKPDPAQLETSRYFDCTNFARYTQANALISCGFIDRTCSPASVWAAYNQLPGVKEMVNMVPTGHATTPEFSRRQRDFVLRELGLSE